MAIIDLRQRTPEWHAWRARGITASEAPVILGRSPYKTPWQLWAERIGLHDAEDLSHNAAVQRGIAFEDRVRQGFEQRHQTLLLPVCAESDSDPVLRCSLDGWSAQHEPVELKVPTHATYDHLRSQGAQSPAYQIAWVQVQFQLFVMDAAHGWLVFDPCTTDEPALEFSIQRDERFIQMELVPACLNFWTLIEQREAPTVDPTRDRYQPQGEAAETWNQLAAAYRPLKVKRQQLEQALETVQRELRSLETHFTELMGNYRQAVAAGIRITRYHQSGTVDYRALVAEIAPQLPPTTLERFRKPASERLKVTLETEAVSATGLDSVETVAARETVIPVPVAPLVPAETANASFYF